MHVLVVDDSLTIRQEVGKALEGQGYQLDYAENGIEALRFALGRRYDLILTDLTMPTLDGLKFIARIRSGGRSADSPVLILTACMEKDSVFRAKDMHVQGYILKPISPDDLRARVQATLEEVRRHSSEESEP